MRVKCRHISNHPVIWLAWRSYLRATYSVPLVCYNMISITHRQQECMYDMLCFLRYSRTSVPFFLWTYDIEYTIASSADMPTMLHWRSDCASVVYARSSSPVETSSQSTFDSPSSVRYSLRGRHTRSGWRKWWQSSGDTSGHVEVLRGVFVNKAKHGNTTLMHTSPRMNMHRRCKQGCNHL